MFKKYFYYLKKSDWLLTLLAVFLVAIGLMIIYSIETTADNPQYLNFQKQLIFFLIGFGIYKQEIYDHYFGFFFPAPFLLVGGLSGYIYKNCKMIWKLLLIKVFCFYELP